MVGLFVFLFVRRSFFGVRPPKNFKKLDINILGLVLYSETHVSMLHISIIHMHRLVSGSTAVDEDGWNLLRQLTPPLLISETWMQP